MQPRPFSAASALAFFPADSQEESFYLASVRQWNDQDVETWLAGCRCGAYAPLFSQNDLRGEVILDLTQNTLKELGITSVGDRARILVAVKQLRQKCYASPSSSPVHKFSPPSARVKARPYTFSAPATPFSSATGATSDNTAPVTPGSAPFYAPTGAIYFSPLPETTTMQPEELPAIRPLSSPDFSGRTATSATPVIQVQNPSPLEPLPAWSGSTQTPNEDEKNATRWGAIGSSLSQPSATAPAPSLADSQTPPLPDDGHRPLQLPQTAPLEPKRRNVALPPAVTTTAPLPHMTHGRKLSNRRMGQLYIAATPPPPAIQSLKAY